MVTLNFIRTFSIVLFFVVAFMSFVMLLKKDIGSMLTLWGVDLVLVLEYLKTYVTEPPRTW